MNFRHAKKRILTALAATALLTAARAQEAPHLQLSLAEAQQYALQHNYSLQNASLEVKKAEAARWQTLATMLPQVTANFDYSNMLGYKMEMGVMSIEMNPYGSLGVQAAVALTGAQVVGTMLSNLSIEMSNISRRQSIQSTYSNVKNVYVSILVMEQTVSLLDSSLANIERLAQTTLDAVRVGAAEQVDADKLAVQVASMQNSINSTRRSLQMLYNSLILQLGADVNSTLELTTSVDELLSVDTATQLLSRNFHIENNFDYQTLQKSADAAKLQVAMAWMNYTPTLSFYYQYSKRTYFGRDEGFNMTPPNMIGASISLPLFKSGSRMAAVREAKIAQQETANTIRQAEDGLRVQYKQLSYDLVSALESYVIQSKNLDVTKRVFDNMAEKYKYGRASSLELTNASTDIITAQSNYISAVMNVVTAQVAFENLLAEEQYDDVVLPGEQKEK
ncbi:MAG: TolC family protein [Bacteroidales bacterium]|nr:TolC family protein [Bacteroidales bacterium]